MPTSTPQPLYQQIKQHILTQIDHGAWPVNHRLPSEHELVTQFGFSRMTINRALRELTDEGRLVRLQGVGTFVAPPKTQSALFEVHSIADEIRQRNGHHHCRVLHSETGQADADLAADLNIPPGSPAFHTQIVHYENTIPIQFEDRWVNPAVAPDYPQQDFTRQTPHDYLVRIAPWTEGEHMVEARLPPKAISEVLQMPKGEPCLVVRRRTWSGPHIVTGVRLWFPASRYRLAGRFVAQD